MGLDEDATRASSPRARGRRRSSSDAEKDTRALIVAAAGDEFAARGYDSASFRSIARTAGVDPALVHHYFSDKADLFAESISAPIRPDHILRSALSGPRDRIGENLVRLLLTAFEDQHSRDRLLAVLRTALGTTPDGDYLDYFVACKRREVQAAHEQITQWELDRYLQLF